MKSSLCAALVLAAAAAGAPLPASAIPHTSREFKTPPWEFAAGEIKSLKPVADIACGQSHTMLLTKDGGAFGFGTNFAGQAAVKIPSGARRVAAGNSFSAVVMENGELKIFGELSGTEKLPLTGCKEVAAGGDSIAVVDESNRVHFGGDLHGEAPVEVPELERVICAGGGALLRLPYFTTTRIGKAPVIPGQTWVKASVYGDSAATIDAKGRCSFYGNSRMRTATMDGVADVLVLKDSTSLLMTDGRIVTNWFNTAGGPAADEAVSVFKLNRKNGVSLRGNDAGGFAVIFADGEVGLAGPELHGMFSYDLDTDGFTSVTCGADKDWGAYFLTAPDGRMIAAGCPSPGACEGHCFQTFIPCGLRRSAAAVAIGDSFVCLSTKDRGVLAWGVNDYKQCELKLSGRPRLMCASESRCYVIDDKGRFAVSGPESGRIRVENFPFKDVVQMDCSAGLLTLVTKDGRLMAATDDAEWRDAGELRLDDVSEAFGMPGGMAVRHRDGSVLVRRGKESQRVCEPGETLQIFANANGLYVLNTKGECLHLNGSDQREPVLPGKPKVRIGGGQHHVYAVSDAGDLLMSGSQQTFMPWLWGEPARISLNQVRGPVKGE